MNRLIHILSLCIGMLPAFLQAQNPVLKNGEASLLSTMQDSPVNPVPDLCGQAKVLKPGQQLTHLYNKFAAIGPASQVPHKIPTTCIESFENDGWFRFQSVPEYGVYEVRINYHTCNTPAGLQAMIIQSDDCNRDNFIYRGCSNNNSMDSIRMILTESRPGINFLIYVDGFDGTICEFDLQLMGRPEQDLNKSDYRYAQFGDGNKAEESWNTGSYQGKFLENAATLSWTSSPEENPAFFVIEQLIERENAPLVSKVMAVVEPKSTVEGGVTSYSYSLTNMVYENGKDYCFRVVKVNQQEKRSVAQKICLNAQVAENIFVNEAKASDAEPGFYDLPYLNRKASQTLTFKLMDEREKVLKSLKMKKVPIEQNFIHLDMREFPKGTYYFQISGGNEEFTRKFEKR